MAGHTGIAALRRCFYRAGPQARGAPKPCRQGRGARPALCRPTATRPVDKHVALRLVRLVARRPIGGNSGPAMTEPRPPCTPSPPLGAERVGVRWGIPERSPTPTSPSRASLSPLRGGEGKIAASGAVVILFPAIDLKGGACVRLVRGEMASATVFNDDPAAQARHFVAI